ncbi:hypothetical protein DRN86_02405 [Candidatus Geothermarchaeota archaeon]|nr:MAG: hypothetical protein DRN86_02405 [Candidatus Geothermarchaeota archaeon]
MPEKICEICGQRPAKYICQKCGALVCEYDIDLASGYCVRCSKTREKVSAPDLAFKLLLLGFIVIFAGLALIFASFFILPLEAGNITGGGLVLIGPIPIAFGFGRELDLILVILAFLMIFLIIIEVLFIRRAIK